MVNFFNKKKSKSGFAMVEIIVAVAIIAASFIFILSVAQRSIVIARDALHQTEASFLLEEGAEATRIVRDTAWFGISSLSAGTTYYPTFSSNTWTLSTTPNTVDGFTRTVVLSTVYRDGNANIAVSGAQDTGTRLVTVNVSWNEAGIVLSKSIQFYIADIFS